MDGLNNAPTKNKSSCFLILGDNRGDNYPDFSPKVRSREVKPIHKDSGLSTPSP